MDVDRRQIIAMGGGGFTEATSDVLLDGYVMSACGVERPRICFLGTALGDHQGLLLKFYTAMAERVCVPSHLPLFVRRGVPRDVLLAQDIIYIGGGNTANMLAIWRAHGVDQVLHEAWQRGIVLAGICAGAMALFAGGVSASFGPLEPFADGLGFLDASFCPHYDSDPNRRPSYHSAISEGLIGAGYGIGDGVALHFRGAELVEAVSCRPAPVAERVQLSEAGGVEEAPLFVRSLAAPQERHDDEFDMGF